jgi:hypothetical protein
MVFFYFLIQYINIYVRVIIFLEGFLCPKMSVPLGLYIRIYISDYPGIFFSFLPCLKKVLWFDSLCPFLIILILLNYLFLVRSSCSENLNFLAFFIFSSGPSASFANCKLTSVDSACLNTQFWFIACRRRRRRRPPPPLHPPQPLHSPCCLQLVVRSCCLLPLSIVSVRRRCLCCRLHCYPRATAVVIRSRRPHPLPSAVVVSRCCLRHHRHSPQCPTAVFHSHRCVSASSAAFGISPKIGKSNF